MQAGHLAASLLPSFWTASQLVQNAILEVPGRLESLTELGVGPFSKH